MIVTKDYKTIKQIQFDTMSIDTEQFTITVSFDEGNKNSVLSIIELYSAVKQMWVRYSDDLMRLPFPFQYLTTDALIFNKPWKLLIQ